MSGLSQTLQTLIYPAFGIGVLVVNHYLFGDGELLKGVGYTIMMAGMVAFNHGAYQQPPK